MQPPPQVCIPRSVTRIAASAAAAFDSSTNKVVEGPGFSMASMTLTRCERARSVSIRICARRARRLGRSANVVPRCSRRLVVRCFVVAWVAASATPTEMAAFPRLNQGKTTSIMVRKPSLGLQSARSVEIAHSRSSIGALAFPRIPRLFQGPLTVNPGSSFNTRYSMVSVGSCPPAVRVETT